MKKFVLALLILFGLCSFNQNWIKITIGSTVTTEFPTIPAIDSEEFLTLYHVINSEYAIIVSFLEDLKYAKPDFNDEDLEEYYRGLIAGTLNASKNSVLQSKKRIKLEDFEGYEIVYEHDYANQKNVICTSKIFVIKQRTYIFSFRNFTDKDKSPLGTKFFESIRMLE